MIRGYPIVAAYEETGDLYHEALVKLFHRYTRRPEAVPEDPLKLIVDVRRALFDVARDLARKHLGPHGFGRNHAGPIKEDRAKDQTSITGGIQDQERNELVLEAIGTLPEDLQLVVWLRYSGEGKKVQEIADFLAVHRKTVDRWLKDAIELLQDKLVVPETW